MKAIHLVTALQNGAKRISVGLVVAAALLHHSARANQAGEDFPNPAPINLGSAASFGVLAGSTVTNTGLTVVDGDLGVNPGTAVTGFPPGIVKGTIHAGDATAAQAQADLTVAYDDAAGRAPDQIFTDGFDLGGQILSSGVYNDPTSLFLTGTLVLDGQGNPDAIFIFQTGSTFITSSGSLVTLIGGAQACNVFFQVGSSATLGTNTAFAGNILALTSITLNTGASIDGRALARNGAVTLDTNASTVCDVVPESSSMLLLLFGGAVLFAFRGVLSHRNAP